MRDEPQLGRIFMHKANNTAIENIYSTLEWGVYPAQSSWHTEWLSHKGYFIVRQPQIVFAPFPFLWRLRGGRKSFA